MTLSKSGDTCRGGSATIAGDEIDRDRSIEEVRSLEAKYRILLEQIPAIVYIWSASAGLEHTAEEYVSPQIEVVLGFRAEEWIANPQLWIERLHPEDREEVIDETSRSMAAGEPFGMEYRMIARDERVVWLHDVASVLDRDEQGRAIRYQGVQLDITARKDAEHAQRRAFNELRALHGVRRELLVRLLTTQENERRRIAEGIHDDSLQALDGILMRLRTIAGDQPELERSEGFTLAIQELVESIVRLRRLAFELHPPTFGPEGLVPALEAYVQRWASTPSPIEYRLEHRFTRQPSNRTSTTVYRIAQEALGNVRKHSRATLVTVSLEDREEGLLVRIEDNGEGFDPEGLSSSDLEHLGLVSMRERADAIGGWWRIESSPGVGTTVEYWLPYDAVASGERAQDEQTATALTEDAPLVSSETSPGEAGLGLAALTARELEVAKLLALGHTHHEIAATLHLSVRSVERHRSRVFAKLGVLSRAGLVRAMREDDQSGAGPD